MSRSQPLRRRISLREIKTIMPGQLVWDTAVIGFYARRQRTDAITYGVKYRTGDGEQRWATIGRHGSPWTPDTARAEAKRILGEVVKGDDPSRMKQEQRTAKTVAELCADYMADAEAGKLSTRRGEPKRASTLETDRSRIAAQILPLLGSRKVASVTTDDIEAFMHDVIAGKAARKQKLGKHAVSNVRGGTGAAARTLGLLGAIFTYAVRKRLRTDNPVRGIIRPADGRRDRRLSADEYAKLSAGLAKKESWPHALAAVRFLALTGWRSGEVTGLRWREIDLDRRTARLQQTKTGASLRPLSHEAVALLAAQRRAVPDTSADALVFPASRGAGAMSGFPRIFQGVVKEGGLSSDVTPHVLRHSFASVAADLGFSEPTIATLIGHKGGGITRRYIHSADAVLLDAAGKVAGEIARLMAGMSEENVLV
jgi:integrase